MVFLYMMDDSKPLLLEHLFLFGLNLAIPYLLLWSLGLKTCRGSSSVLKCIQDHVLHSGATSLNFQTLPVDTRLQLSWVLDDLYKLIW